MTEKEELNAIYKAILAAARQNELVGYSDLIALLDLANGQRPNVALKTRLHTLLKICGRRNWPAMSAIVVGKHDVLLSDTGLLSFMEGSRNAGYAVQDPRAFEAEQKEALYRWAPSAPNSLDLSDHELRELSQATRGADANYFVRIQRARHKMKKVLRVGWIFLWLKGFWKTILVPVFTAVMTGLILLYHREIWHFFKQL